jgi:abortive infection Abi-like protein
MADSTSGPVVLLPACRELLDLYPDSVRIREQVEALEEAMPDRPGVVVSFCRTIIETACRTILTDRGVAVDSAWEAPKLVAETLRYVNLGPRDDGSVDGKLRSGAESLVRGLNQIVSGIVEIRNAHGSAAHGADAYSPLLDSRYAEILARATDAVVGLLFKIHLASAQRDPLARFRYGDHSDFDELIDNDFGPFKVLEVQLVASEALFRTDFLAYRAALVQFKQEQQQSTTAVVPVSVTPEPQEAEESTGAEGAGSGETPE